MIKIKITDVNGDENKLISKFKKKIKDSKILLEMRERKEHTSYKDKKRHKKKMSKYRIQKEKNNIKKSKI